MPRRRYPNRRVRAAARRRNIPAMIISVPVAATIIMAGGVAAMLCGFAAFMP